MTKFISTQTQSQTEYHNVCLSRWDDVALVHIAALIDYLTYNASTRDTHISPIKIIAKWLPRTKYTHTNSTDGWKLWGSPISSAPPAAAEALCIFVLSLFKIICESKTTFRPSGIHPIKAQNKELEIAALTQCEMCCYPGILASFFNLFDSRCELNTCHPHRTFIYRHRGRDDLKQSLYFSPNAQTNTGRKNGPKQKQKKKQPPISQRTIVCGVVLCVYIRAQSSCDTTTTTRSTISWKVCFSTEGTLFVNTRKYKLFALACKRDNSCECWWYNIKGCCVCEAWRPMRSFWFECRMTARIGGNFEYNFKDNVNFCFENKKSSL